VLSLLAVVLKHKRAVIAVTAAGFLISAIVSVLLPPRFVSSSAFITLSVAQDVTALREYFAAFGSFGESFAMTLRGQKNLIVDAILRTDRVADLIVRRFDLVNVYGADDEREARRTLRRNTRVTIKDEGVFLLNVEDRSPERACGIAKAYIAVLDSLLLEVTVQNARENVEFFGVEIVRIEREISASDSLLAAYLQLHGMYDVEEQMRAMLDVVAAVSTRLSLVDFEKRILETVMKPGTPSYERAKLEWEKLREQLLMLRDTGAEPALFPSFRSIPTITAGYVHLMSQRRVQEFVHAFLRVRRAEAQVAAESGISTIRILDPPNVPEKRSWPMRKQIVLFSTAASFLWAALGLLLRERLRDGSLVLRPYEARESPAADERAAG